jgi:hypothetical protein
MIPASLLSLVTRKFWSSDDLFMGPAALMAASRASIESFAVTEEDEDEAFEAASASRAALEMLIVLGIVAGDAVLAGVVCRVIDD